ncbi:MAG: hypothetical protein LBT54_05595, partial [Bifidobacteriaceae bacterium]|nr:hypothetical protein [Bifidobacteriaceae bacterium]
MSITFTRPRLNGKAAIAGLLALGLAASAGPLAAQADDPATGPCASLLAITNLTEASLTAAAQCVSNPANYTEARYTTSSWQKFTALRDIGVGM